MVRVISEGHEYSSIPLIFNGEEWGPARGIWSHRTPIIHHVTTVHIADINIILESTVTG